MSDINRIDVASSHTATCSSKRIDQIKSIGSIGDQLMKDYFGKIPDPVSDEQFGKAVKILMGNSVNKTTLNLFLLSQKHREEFLRKMDGGKTKNIDLAIKQGADIKPILLKMVDGSSDVIDDAMVDIVSKYEAYKKKMTEAEYHNYLFGTKLQTNTPVIYDGKKTTYHEAWHQLIRDITKKELTELKEKCST